MYSVYQHWDPLKTCIVGKSYPPEFYSWITNSNARSAMERIAQETEEDYQELIKLLNKFNVDVLRPKVSGNHEEYYNSAYNTYDIPPMTPRDYIGVYDKVFMEKFNSSNDYIGKLYNDVKDESWTHNVQSYDDIHKLPSNILDELYNDFNLKDAITHNFEYSKSISARNSIYSALQHGIPTDIIQWGDTSAEMFTANNASVSRIGRDLYFPSNKKSEIHEHFMTSDKYRLNLYDGFTHADSCFTAVVPGLIISIDDYQNYSKTFPDWEVVYLPDQSWDKVKPFMELKNKNQGKWWVPGEETNNNLTELVETWLHHWVGYVEETVFDTNMLVIDKHNVIVNNHNKEVFSALERHNVTPHICNFRHRYFWDGGLHCITADLHREGEINDYFPIRNYKIKEF